MQMASQVLYRVYLQHKRSNTVEFNARNTLSIQIGCSKTHVPTFKSPRYRTDYANDSIFCNL